MNNDSFDPGSIPGPPSAATLPVLQRCLADATADLAAYETSIANGNSDSQIALSGQTRDARQYQQDARAVALAEKQAKVAKLTAMVAEASGA